MFQHRYDIRCQVFGKIFDIEPVPLADFFSRLYFTYSFGQIVDQYNIENSFQGFFFCVRYKRIFIQNLHPDAHFFLDSSFGHFSQILIFSDSSSAKLLKISVAMLVEHDLAIFHYHWSGSYYDFVHNFLLKFIYFLPYKYLSADSRASCNNLGRRPLKLLQLFRVRIHF